MQSVNKLLRSTISKNKKDFTRHLYQSERCASTIEVPPKTKEAPPTIKEVPPQFTIPKGIMGQPTCYTHPHLIAEGQLTCGITQAEYRERRETFVKKIMEEAEHPSKDQVIVIPASSKKYMSDKIPYTFRQNSDFFYLTGCLEPSAILVIKKPSKSENFESILFVHDKDDHAEMWEGPRTGCDAAEQLFAVDKTFPVESFQNFMSKSLCSRHSVLWYNNEEPPNQEVHNMLGSTVRSHNQMSLSNPKRTLHLMRVIKSPAEVKLMKKTCLIGAQTMNIAMCCTKPGMSEHSINALLEYTCRQSGAEHLAFPPVVAGGARATHIHYIANDQILRPDEMLLIDSGTQRWMYNSDLARTWPVSGRFNKYDRILYEIVLSVQKRLIQLLGENRPSLDQLFDQMCRLLGTYLQQEGILSKDITPSLLTEKAYRLCPHHVSHYLGLDVHDSPLVRRHLPVRTNMVVTVEPGIYISPNDTSVPEEFRGTGIRIEDDVLITDDVPVILTDACYKEVDEIEENVGKHSLL